MLQMSESRIKQQHLGSMNNIFLTYYLFISAMLALTND